MSALKTVFAAAVLSIGFAGVAHARDILTIRTSAPVDQTRVIVDQVIWNCAGDTCTARPNRAASVRACRQFVRETGAQIVSYGTDARQLTSDELGRCNGQTQQASN